MKVYITICSEAESGIKKVKAFDTFDKANAFAKEWFRFEETTTEYIREEDAEEGETCYDVDEAAGEYQLYEKGDYNNTYASAIVFEKEIE